MPAIIRERLLSRLTAFPDARRCWIAYSGGMDSEVLLHAVASLGARLPAQVRAVHVDHGLHPDSGRWTEYCRRGCARLGVPLSVRRMAVAPSRGESLEAVAREARYRVMGDLLGHGDLLLTGQHRDDQAETLLLALMRGSGLKGLAAMPTVAPLGEGRLVRPLLDVGRAELRDYAIDNRLSWVEDPTNLDAAFDRNFIRHRVLPLLAVRWPAYAVTLARTAGHCAEAQGLIHRLAERELPKVAGLHPGTLSVSGLRTMDRRLGRAVLRHWIAEGGFGLPDARHLSRILDEVLTAREDAQPLVAWRGCEVRRYRDDLFALAPLPPVPRALSIPWRKNPLVLPEGLGTLRILGRSERPVDPEGLVIGGLTVRFGVTGLSCRPAGSRHHRPLKKLFQETGVPPWLRPYVPLVFVGSCLAAVGHLWICDSLGVGDPTRIALRWCGHPWESAGLL